MIIQFYIGTMLGNGARYEWPSYIAQPVTIKIYNRLDEYVCSL